MPQATIDRLIVNSPYSEPERYWHYDRQSRLFELVEGRRPAGYLMASSDSKVFDDPGSFVEIPLVNRIRQRVRAWREAKYPGVTGITRRLLEYWNDPEGDGISRLFFCQLEAAETLIWLTEASVPERLGVEIPSDGGGFQRLCAKMATGSGKTVVMAMVIAWHVLNKVAYPHDNRFTKSILIIAPGLTVRNRLGVLEPSHSENYYDLFRIVPSSMLDKLRSGRVIIRNWQALNWDTDEKIAGKRGVDKRGAMSDEAYVREVLGEMARARNLLVINDEAHHAWRIPGGFKAKGVSRDEVTSATRWIGGLDRIDRARRILSCYDFSATPFAPSGSRSSEEGLFEWIVSDFGLNDAIESGLVKTPRVVIRDDAPVDSRTYKSRLYHLYNDPEVKDDLNRRAKAEEPLPDLVINGYYLLGYDWRETAKVWAAQSSKNIPVMITVANRTETAARIKYAFDHGRIHIDQLCDPERTLHIDSKVLDSAEAGENPIAEVGLGEEADAVRQHRLTRKQQAELLRRQVDTIGRPGREGERIQNVISVGMLSEGWDAKTVTHIMGLRAFTSQLLCEQVVGRGLRRTSYDVNEEGLFEPEYVNIFGVPFTFLPHEIEGDGPPQPSKPKTLIEPKSERSALAISWPNVIRINRAYRPRLSLDWGTVGQLDLDAAQTRGIAELAPIIDGKADMTKIGTIELKELARELRTQRIVFETARDVYEQMGSDWKANKVLMLAQLVRLVEEFIRSDRVNIVPGFLAQEDLWMRLIITLNMTKVVQHIWSAIRFENTERLEPVFDRDRPILSTSDMRPWYTGKPCGYTQRSHINCCVYDSTWEASDARTLDHASGVVAWAKNDHLGFEISYVHGGIVRRYRPDFLIRLTSGDMLVLETKGRETDQDRTKREFLGEWVKAVNMHGGFGRWRCDVAFAPGELEGIIAKYTSSGA